MVGPPQSATINGGLKAHLMVHLATPEPLGTGPVTSSRQEDFHFALFDLYRTTWRECGFGPAYGFALNKDGGPAAARVVLSRPLSKDFERLRELGRLDLTVENLILDPRWDDLFDGTLRDTARMRLGRCSDGPPG